MAAADNKGINIRPEAELLLCMARLRPDEDAQGRERHLLQENLDWNYLLELALRYKVMPLVYRQIKADFSETVPAEFMERLRDYFYLNAARNHLLTEELCEVLHLFEKSGLHAVTYKGPALAAGVYGDVAFRQFSDLDIMVKKDDVAKASKLLRQRDYRKEHDLMDTQDAAFLKVDCEHMFFREEGRIFLDLHWGFTPSYFPIKLDLETIWKRIRPVTLARTQQALTFSPEDLLLILSVNAGKEFWSGLISLCDIAELTRTYPNLDWERIMLDAKGAGVRRMLFVSLSLSSELLGANIPQQVSQSMAEDKGVRPLAFAVRQKLFGNEQAAGAVSQILKPAKALDSLRARARFHLRLALTPTLEDWTFISLPNRLRFLYYLTRPLRLAKKYVLHQAFNRRRINSDVIRKT